MNTPLKPHSLLTIYRPDEVAECLSGVSPDLYEFIWNVMVPMLPPRNPNIEDMGPEIESGSTVADMWERIPEDRQAELNAVAAKNDTCTEENF